MPRATASRAPCALALRLQGAGNLPGGGVRQGASQGGLQKPSRLLAAARSTEARRRAHCGLELHAARVEVDPRKAAEARGQRESSLAALHKASPRPRKGQGLRQEDLQGTAATLQAFAGRAAASQVVLKAKMVAFLDASAWQQALAVGQAMLRDRRARRRFVCPMVIRAHQLGKQWRQALCLFHQMKRERLDPNKDAYRAAMLASATGNQWEGIVQLLRGWRLGGKADDSVYASAIKALALCEQWQRGLSFLRDVHKRGRPRGSLYLAAITASAKVGSWRLAVCLLEEIQRFELKPDQDMYLSTISACIKPAQWQVALNLLSSMAVSGVQQRVNVYNNVLSACVNGGQWEWALRLLQVMPLSGCWPTVWTFNLAIRACGQCGKWEWALQLLTELRMSLWDPDIITYGTATSACETGQAWAHALALLSEMPRFTVEADVIMYSAAVSSCGQGQQWEPALGLVKDMQCSHVLPNAHSFSAAISACETVQQWACALHVLEGTRRQHVKLDTVTVNAAASACTGAEQWRTALHLVQGLRHVHLMPTLGSYLAALRACWTNQQWLQAVQLLGLMVQCRAWPAAATLSIVVDTCHQGGQSGQVLLLLRAMRRQTLGRPRRGLLPSGVARTDSLDDLKQAFVVAEALHLHGCLDGRLAAIFCKAAYEPTLPSLRSLCASEQGSCGSDAGSPLTRLSSLGCVLTNLALADLGLVHGQLAWVARARCAVRDSLHSSDITFLHHQNAPVTTVTAWVAHSDWLLLQPTPRPKANAYAQGANCGGRPMGQGACEDPCELHPSRLAPLELFRPAFGRDRPAQAVQEALLAALRSALLVVARA